MKPNAPMSTLSTNNIINHCLDEEFSYNSIKNVRHNIYTDNLEAVVELSKNGCRYISGKFDQPNQWKLEWILFFINSVILKHKLNINCVAVINFNDGIQPNQFYTRLAWHRHKDSPHVCIPDPLTCGHLIMNNKIREYRSNDIPVEKKEMKAIFRGSDTGKIRNNLKNQRIEVCHSLKDSKLIDAKITSWLHFNPDLLKEHGMNIKTLETLSRSSSQEQLKYKYLLYMHGNSVSPDRIMWHLDSNSIVIQPKPRTLEMDYTWACSYIYDHKLIPILEEQLLEVELEELDKNGDLFSINKRQQEFAKIVLDIKTQEQYLANVLTRYNSIYNS